MGLHPFTAEVAPLAPGVAYGLATLGTMLAFLVCYGMRHAWEATLGYGFRWLASKIRDVSISTGFFGSIHPFGFLADALEAVDKVISHYLAVAAINTEKAFVYCADQTAQMFVWAGREIYGLSRDMLGAFEHFNRVVLPRWFGHALRYTEHLVSSAVHPLRAETRHLERALRREEHVAEAKIRHVEHVATHALDWAEGEVRVIDHDLAKLRARARSLEDGAVRTFEWLRSHERSAAFGTFAAAVALALSRLGLDFLKCPQFGRINSKRGCGLWSDLDALLGLAFIPLAIGSLDELVKVAQVVTEDVTKAAEELLKV